MVSREKPRRCRPTMLKARQIRPIAERHSIRDEIVLERRHASQERVRADPRELDDRRTAAEDGEIVNRAVAGEHDVLEKITLLPMWQSCPTWNLREGAAVSHHRREAAACSPGVHGDAFPDQAFGADRQRRGFSLELQVLRLMADGREGKDAGARADSSCARPRPRG